MSAKEKILSTEYSPAFDELRKDRMVVSHYKYGFIKENTELNLVKMIPTLEMRLDMYKSTGNTEFLCDIANFAMIEFMYPQHPKAHFKTLDDGKNHIVGMSMNQIKRFDDYTGR